MVNRRIDLSRSPLEPKIKHYYGNRIRILFFVSAIISFVVIPVWGNLFPFSIVIQVIGGMTLVLLAGLTSPHNKAVMLCNAMASALGAILLEIVAVEFRSEQSVQLFMLREAEAVMLLIAFYFCIKTLRAMFLGYIGKEEPAGEEYVATHSTSDGG